MSAAKPPEGTVPSPGALSALVEELATRGAGEAAGGTPTAGEWIAGRFEVVREIGRGGFGVVLEARDAVLDRPVALKFFRPGALVRRPGAPELAEADAIARLSHPNIVQIHDRGTSPAGPFLVLELLDGEPLSRRIQRGRFDPAEALRVVLGIARGLAHAHLRGVVHRDLKPGNVFLCSDGQVKVLDFGLAHLVGREIRVEGGTPGWMAPEQHRGEPGDERTDVWALGAMLYRMLAGADPSSARLSVPGVPDLEALVEAMLAEEPAARPRDAGRVVEALESVARRMDWHPDSAPREVAVETSRLPRKVAFPRPVVALLAVAAVALVALAGWFIHRQSRVRWALEQGLPGIAELAEHGNYPAALALAEEVERVIPDSARLRQLLPEISRRRDVETTPVGADVWVKPYEAPETAWRLLGKTPIRGARIPQAILLWRFEKPGFATVERMPRGVSPAGLALHEAIAVALDPEGVLPAGMVRVPGGPFAPDIPGIDHLPELRLGDFLVDRTEVTNADFKRFVDAGGYRRREYWKHAFVKAGRALGFEEAVAQFVDRTGRPGPATWEAGGPPDGQGALPVTGVSWFEAAAFAEFAGKSLPTVYQWALAAGGWASSRIVPASNFGANGLAPVGTFAGVGPYGTRDMAGNAKEWCWNAAADRRYVLGGAWNEPSYMFNDLDAQSPFSRGPTFGFRLVRALDGTTDPATAAPLTVDVRDYGKERPASDEAFRSYRRLYAYDPAPLDARTEATDDSEEGWRREKVSYAAAYGGERVTAYLFTPRHGTPPFQTVLFFPGSNAIHLRSSEPLAGMRLLRPLLKSGRALLYPVYKSTFERGDALQSDLPAPTAFYRDHVVMWSKDVGRSIDYLASRSDLDARQVAYYGVSWGAMLGPLFAAVDDRIGAMVLVGGGLGLQAAMPEVDPFHFAPRARQPALMVNGRYDFFFPYDTSQLPLFRTLGAPAERKRHVVVEAGHVPPNDLLTREMLDWLDRWMGPVR